MSRWTFTGGTAAAFVLLGVSLFGQDGRRASPNALCVHSTGPLEKGDGDVWITLPDHHYLGSPTFSPDGKWIAFDAYRSDTEKVVCEVWKVRSDGRDPQKLAIGATPRWSPDGKKLLFMREKRNLDERQQHGVFRIDSDGTNETFICEGRWPDWSPDGSRIVFSRDTSNIRGGVQELARIYVANADGSNPEPLANGDCPAWSPDGTLIACSYSDPAFRAPMIRIIEIESNRQWFIGYGWHRANWVADSGSVTANGVMADRTEGPVRLSIKDRSGKPSAVTDVEGAASPCFSPDGLFLVFAAPHTVKAVDTCNP